jgi:TPP-dependent pyruvate/acetoin dehydrogenase alpha subunit
VSVPGPAGDLDVEGRRHLLVDMLRIRRFEERCVELYSASEIRGFLHLSIGEEACAVGVMRALGSQDAVVSTYRPGLSMRSIMAELEGEQGRRLQPRPWGFDGFGKVAERSWAEGGLLGARPTVTATLAADHRVSDGHRGGLFLSTIDHLLQAPEDL